METKLIINCLKQTLTELRDEKYQQEKNGLYKAGIDFVNMLEEALIIDGVSKSFFCQHELVLDCKEQCFKCQKIDS